MSGALTYSGLQTAAKKSLEEQKLPFLKEDQYTDTVLVVEGRKLYISRALLGFASPYFQRMLENAHKSAVAEKKSKAEIRMAEKSYMDMVDMLAFLHPGVCRELTEKMALRLLPLSHEFQMFALKDRCEKVLVTALKNTNFATVKGPPQQRNRRDNTPEILLKCIKAADNDVSTTVLATCLRMFANPQIPLKDLKTSSDISPTTKSKIFESRMDNAAYKINKVANELDREKHEKEMLKKQLKDKFPAQQKHAAFGYALSGVDKSVDKPVGPKISARHPQHFNSHKRPFDRRPVQSSVNSFTPPRT